MSEIRQALLSVNQRVENKLLLMINYQRKKHKRIRKFILCCINEMYFNMHNINYTLLLTILRDSKINIHILVLSNLFLKIK